MARKIVVVDDITGEEGAQEITFAFRGVEYAIDLTDAGVEELGSLLDPYITRGQRVGGKGGQVRSKPSTVAPGVHPDYGRHSKDERVAVREFIAQKGIIVAGNTRIPVDIWEAWRAHEAGDAGWRSLLRPSRLPSPPDSARPAEEKGEPAPKRSRARSRNSDDQPELTEASA